MRPHPVGPTPPRKARTGMAGLRGTAQDMTAPRKAEAERERIRFLDIEVGRLKGLADMRSDFLNAAAHDLNNPLTPIMFQLAAMTRAAGTDEARLASIRILQRNVRRLQVIIQDILDCSRLQSGGLTLNSTPCDLRNLLAQAIESFETVAAAEGITISLDAGLVTIVLDEGRIGQVMYNLLSNAIKYSSTGDHVEVALSLVGGNVRVRVTDSGLGLTPVQAEGLFQPFVRLHEHVVGAAKGTGLGLYICKGLVEAHGGRIWATSPGAGQGSTFIFELPLGGAP